MQESKACTNCGQTKPLDAYGKHKTGKDGLRSQCRFCHNASGKAYRKANPEKVAANRNAWAEANPGYKRDYHQANAESISALKKAYAQANPEKARAYYRANLEKITATNKRWREANLEKVAADGKAYQQANIKKIKALRIAWRRANPDKVAAINRKWQKDNPESKALSDHKRRAQRLGSGLFKIAAKEIEKLYASPCAYCNAPSKHIDHIIPLSRGGRHSIGNLTGACASCNLSKGAKFITEWKRDK